MTLFQLLRRILNYQIFPKKEKKSCYVVQKKNQLRIIFFNYAEESNFAYIVNLRNNAFPYKNIYFTQITLNIKFKSQMSYQFYSLSNTV